MIKIRPSLSILVALLLVAGPWLYSTEQAAASNHTASCSCQMPAPACCDTAPLPTKHEQSDESCQDCRCHISTAPDTSQLPLEIHEHRVDRQHSKTALTSSLFAEFESRSDHRLFSRGNSPPVALYTPAYVMFGAFLI